MHSTAPIWPDGDWQDPSMTALTRGLLHLQDIDKFVPKKFQHYIGGGPAMCAAAIPLRSPGPPAGVCRGAEDMAL